MSSCRVSAAEASRSSRATLGLALVWAAVVLLSASPAEACTCIGSRLSRSVVPADGAREVPTDSVVRVFLGGGWPVEAREALRSEYRLVDDTGRVVPAAVASLDNTLTLTPTATLAPGRTYSVERLYLYRRGEQVSDEHRVALAQRDDDPGRTNDERRWFADSRFQTSPRPVRAPRARAELLRAEPYYSDNTSCGPTSQLTVAYALDRAPGPLEVLALELEGRGLLRIFEPPARRRDELVLQAGMCVPDPIFLGADSPPVRVVLLDSGGRTITASAYAPAGWVGPLRERPEPPWPTPRPLPRLVERFATPPIGLDPAATVQACRTLCQAAASATLVTVVHDPALLPLLADRVIGLAAGRVVFDGPQHELDPRALAALYAPVNAADAHLGDARLILSNAGTPLAAG